MIDYLETEYGNYTEGGRTIPNDPENRDFQTMNQEIEDGEAQIIPWTQYRDISDDDLRTQRYNEDAAYADTLIFEAESQQTQGTVWDNRKTNKENGRRNNRGRTKDKITDADDYLADYIDRVFDDLDQADDSVENLGRDGLEAWDSATSASWTAWIPLP